MNIPPALQYIAIGILIVVFILAIGYFGISTAQPGSDTIQLSNQVLFADEINKLNVAIDTIEKFESGDSTHEVVKLINENLNFNIKITGISKDLMKMLKSISISDVEMYDVNKKFVTKLPKNMRKTLDLIQSNTNIEDVHIQDPENSGFITNADKSFEFNKTFSYDDLVQENSQYLFYSKSEDQNNTFTIKFVSNGDKTIEKIFNFTVQPQDVPIPPQVNAANSDQLDLIFNSVHNNLEITPSTNAFYEYQVGNSGTLVQNEKMSLRYNTTTPDGNLYNLYKNDPPSLVFSFVKVNQSLMQENLAFLSVHEDDQMKIVHKINDNFVAKQTFDHSQVVHIKLSDVEPTKMVASQNTFAKKTNNQVQNFYMYHSGDNFIGTNKRPASAKSTSATQDEWFKIIKSDIQDADLYLDPNGSHFIIRNKNGKNAKGIQYIDNKRFVNSGYSSSSNGRYVRLIAV
jgi:hypothetical protein